MSKDEWNITISTEEENDWIHSQMDEFNRQQVSFHGDAEVLKDYVVKENSLVIAGIRSCFYLGKCLAINVLFVDEEHRHKGLGTLLLNKVENEAKSMGAKVNDNCIFCNFY